MMIITMWSLPTKRRVADAQIVNREAVEELEVALEYCLRGSKDPPSLIGIRVALSIKLSCGGRGAVLFADEYCFRRCI